MSGDTGAAFSVNFASGQTVNLDQLRRLGENFMPFGRHGWVISTVFVIEDPEKAMDDMELGPENFVGVTAIRCLLCNEEYRTAIRYEKCTRRPSA